MVYDPRAAREQALYQGLLGLGANLMAAGAPSTRPGGFGSALGQGLLGFQQGQQSYMGNAMRQGLLGMQMEQAQREEDRRKQYASLFQAPTGAQVLSANPGGPTVANAQTMANPPVNPMLAGLTPQQIAMARVAEPDKGLGMIADFQKQAMAPPQSRTLERDGVKVTQEWNPAQRAYVDVASSAPDWQNPNYVATQKAIRAAGRSETNVNLPAGLKKEDEEIGKFWGETYGNLQKDAMTAPGKIATFQRLDGLLDQVPRTGAGGEAWQAIRKTSQALGIDLGNVGPGEAAKVIANELALQARNPSAGAGMPGAMSDSDRNFLVEMVPGLGMTPEGRKLVIQANIAVERRKVEVAKKAAEYRRKNRTLEGFTEDLAAWADQNPVFDATFMQKVRQAGGPSINAPMPPGNIPPPPSGFTVVSP